MRDGLPIGLGYFAVAFSLGIVARNAGLTPFQGFIASFFCVASASEYALFTSIQTAASFVEIALITLVVNARYLLMSTALTQRFDPKTSLMHRFFIGFGVTDEIFGITIARPGYINPIYNYAYCSSTLEYWNFTWNYSRQFFTSPHCERTFCCTLWNVSCNYCSTSKRKSCNYDFCSY